ncbi:MAG: FAD-dependent oxidoreductase [Opitutaceae bacterium]|jgi:ribulose 1,5-bisphosphate synthetase/thiazole synthase|nr:FAD-dependent oxidoreductase [Opitutaceae bacterium]
MQPSRTLCYYQPPRAVVGRAIETDVCVYGATSAGVTAAVQTARLGLRAVVINPAWNLGGMTAGGLGCTDVGNLRAIGGLAREFYQNVGRRYGVELATRFEPRVAEGVFRRWLEEAGVEVFHGGFLQGAQKAGGRLRSLTTESGLTVRAGMFIDATYEGDLLARAGVRYRTGREDNREHGETLNGTQVPADNNRGVIDDPYVNQFYLPVDPYIIPGKPDSGLLYGIEPGPLSGAGAGDHRVQAYCFRMCLTRQAGNRVPFPKPAGYDPAHYELLRRYLAAGWRDMFRKFDPIPGGKTDTNNPGAVSTDFIGGSHAWPEGGYAARERIFQEHVRWQQGLMWFLANEGSVPAEVRAPMSAWGLAADEFVATQNWPHQLYVREARRMVAGVVMTEHHCRGAEVAEDPVGMAAYQMDSHHTRRFVRDGVVWNEGEVQVHGNPAYPVSYRAIIPARGQCENLVVPVCLSASHIAYGSIRMEPVFLVLGQSAAVAAALALRGKCALQDLPYGALRAALLESGQVLEVSVQAVDTQTGV